jgi:23S rRNA pseudouridine2605 synthase
MRLNQYLARHAGLSRRGADAAITAGRVLVNNQPANLGMQIGEGDQVALDGKTLKAQPKLYYAYNKPVGVISSRVRQGNTPTLYEALPASFAGLKTVGRLDKDSCGLIILTNDGGLAQRLTHPSFDKQKIYNVSLNRPLSAADKDKIIRGITLDDGLSRFQVDGGGLYFKVILTQGRNRQIRRTFAKLGYRVIALERTTFGKFNLAGLPTGQYRAVRPEELE